MTALTAVSAVLRRVSWKQGLPFHQRLSRPFLHLFTPFLRPLSNAANDRIVRSPLPDVQIPEVPIHDFVFRRFDEFGDRTAIVDGSTGQSYTFVQLKEAVNRFAFALTRRDFTSGDTVCLFFANRPDYAVAYFGTTKAGGKVSTANPTYTPRELAYQLRNSDSKFVVTSPDLVDVVKEAAAEVGGVQEIFVVDALSPVPSGCTGLSELLKVDSTCTFQQPKISVKKDVATLPYSSGTTGLSKGVMLSHYNLVANICQLTSDRRILKVADDDRVCLALMPFYHIYGMVVILARGLEQGTTLVTLPKFEPELFLKTLQDYKVTTAPIVPPLALFLAKHPDVDNYDLSNILDLMSGAAPLSGDITTTICNRLGTKCVRQAYGLTETSPVTHVNFRDNVRPGSVGYCLNNTECKIINPETKVSLGPNEEGEVCIRGPQVMLGYLKNPKATAEMIDGEGWLHSGDLGYYDEDHFFFITDRLKELIKVKGFQVPPAELEALLLTNPDITDAAVIGVPDERVGEVPKAFVVRRSGSSLNEMDVHDFVNKSVAPVKQLAGGIKFVESVPKSPSGKILRRLLRGKQE
eukprot:m.235533 g.235533  ORF g.235533 m.235533 type:complete len:578 (+) comp40127_c3_seq4:96-1829(+)